jgi:hypothetical protein
MKVGWLPKPEEIEEHDIRNSIKKTLIFGFCTPFFGPRHTSNFDTQNFNILRYFEDPLVKGYY